MTKLTKREKRMLYLLGCFTLVVVGVYLLILPAITTQANLSAQLKELEAQQNVRVEAIRKMGTLSAEINTLKSNMEHTCARYAPPMYTEQLDRQYTSMLRRYNANPINMEIGEVTQTPMPHYRAGIEQEAPALDAEEVAPIESYMATVNTEGTIIDTTPVPPPPDNSPPPISAEDATIDSLLLKINATMKPADAMAFLAELSADPTVVLQAMSVSAFEDLAEDGAKLASDKVALEVSFLHIIAPDLPYGDSTAPSDNATGIIFG